MSTQHRDYATRGGVIHYGPVGCKDDYPNMMSSPDLFSPIHPRGQSYKNHAAIKLQAPAFHSFRNAERRLGRATTRFRKTRAILLSGSWRSCAAQTADHARDPGRFADPSVTGHTRGFCIDVDQNQPFLHQANAALRAEGWGQARPSDEPWHWSAPGAPVV